VKKKMTHGKKIAGSMVPKSGAEMVRMLASRGVTLDTFWIEKNSICGMMSSRSVPGWNYRSHPHSWDHLKWFRSGTGGADGRGNGRYGYEIYLDQFSTDLRKEILDLWSAWQEAMDEVNTVEAECNLESQRASADAYKRHAECVGLDGLRKTRDMEREKFVALFRGGKKK